MTPPVRPPAAVAFIGLGNMGVPMAARLIEAGYKVTGCDAAPAARERFAAIAGAASVADVAAAVAGVPVVITMLPDGKAVAVVVATMRPHLAPGAIVIDMSSSDPVGTRALGAELAAAAIRLIDAPVSGGVKRAVDGSLSIMVGGAAADLERARPVFAAMGRTITLCGPAGAGHALKALNNYLSAAGVVAMCEALIVGEAFGLDPGTMVDVFNTSTGKSNATEVKGRQFVVPRTFAAGFSMALMAKDLRTAGDVASHLKLKVPNLEQAVAYWTDADGKLGKGADHTEIFRYAEMLADKEGA